MKVLKEFWELKWLWGTALIMFGILFCFMYYKSHYCKEIPYESNCKKCIRWVEKDNGMNGKFRRTWEECDEYQYYDCIRTYDSCGCTKLH